jgi:hypothetical protein
MARVGAAAACFAIAVILLALDPFIPDYDVDPVVLFALLGTGAALLGVEVRSVMRGPK